MKGDSTMKIEVCIRPMVSVLIAEWDGEGKKPLDNKENLKRIENKLKNIVGSEVAAEIKIIKKDRIAHLSINDDENKFRICDELTHSGLSARWIR